MVRGGGERGDLFGPGAVPGADLDQDGVVVEEAGVLEARAVVVQQRHRVLVLQVVYDYGLVSKITFFGHFEQLKWQNCSNIERVLLGQKVPTNIFDFLGRYVCSILP